jgi:hypothetical protein
MRGNLAELMRKVLATLSPREEQILRMRFGIGQTDCTPRRGRQTVRRHARTDSPNRGEGAGQTAGG